MDAGHEFAQGGLLPKAAVSKVRVERAGTCPRGHNWYRINSSNYIEHIAYKGDLDVIQCPHAVTWFPQEDE